MTLLEAINTVIIGAIPLLIFYFGYRLERKHRIEKEEKQEEQDAIEGKHRSRIQFELEAKFFGPQKGHFIAEITMLLLNKGLVKNKLNELLLTIKGIEESEDIGLFMNKKDPKLVDQKNLKSIANFPEEFVKTNVLKKEGEENEKKKDDKKENDQKKEKEWFVEPGVVQHFTPRWRAFETRVPPYPGYS